MARKIKCSCGGEVTCTGTVTHNVDGGEYLIIRYRRCKKCKKVFKTFEKIKIPNIEN